MLRRVALVVAVIALVLIGAVVKTLFDAGQFKTLHPHFAGECRLVTGAIGTEDLTIHPRTGVVYVSAYDRRAARRGEPVSGGIYAYDLGAEAPALVYLTPELGGSFRPHGISLWVGDDGREVLFAISHPPADVGLPAHTVEVFELEDGALRHRRTLSDPELLVTPNDLVAVGPDSFYLTNTHQSPHGYGQTLENFLRLAGAKVVFYDGARFRPALEDLRFPNGINLSPDGRTLYVATTTPQRLLVYDRDPATETLSKRDEVFIGSGLDNIEIDAAGRLWIGSHPKLLAVRAHAADPSVPSPSQVFRVSPAAGGGYRVEEIYLDDGTEISASSVAAARGRRLLIGQVFGEGILDCRMD